MSIAERIASARAYLARVYSATSSVSDSDINDAANLYASSYEEYCTIWNALFNGNMGL